MSAPEILDKKTVHEGWAKYSVLQVRLRTGQTVTRELEEHGTAVTVLPYDPERKVAILVKQFRAPVMVETGATAFLEIIAGLSDDQPPDEAARREASEETGLKLRELDHVAHLWTMPGLSTERMDLFLASYTQADRVGLGGGAEGEHEDIIVVEVPLTQLAHMVDAGTLNDMKTFALVQTLRLRKPELFD